MHAIIRPVIINLPAIFTILALIFHSEGRAQGMTVAQTLRGQEASNEAKAREVLRKVFEATIGADTKKIENFAVKTQSVLTGRAATVELIITETTKFPDQTKLVFEQKEGTRIQVLDGEHGWTKIGTFFSDLTMLQKREIQRALFRDNLNLLQIYEELEVELIGPERAGTIELVVIRVKSESGDFADLYVDTETFLIRQKTYRGAFEAGLTIIKESYEDYRSFDGIKIPGHTIVRANGRQSLESHIIEAHINVPIANDFFLKR